MSLTQESNQTSQEDGCRRTVVWLIRLSLMAVVAIICLVAALLIVVTWQSARLDSLVGETANQSHLQPLERLYLQGYLASRADDLQKPIGSGSQLTSFTIEPGQTADQIADSLAVANLLQDKILFRNYLRYTGLDSQLEAGTYEINPLWTMPELANIFLRALPQAVELRFLEGWRIEEMAAYLEQIQPAEIDPAEFLALAKGDMILDQSEYGFLASLPSGATLEGFLFPDTYRVDNDADAAMLIRMMLNNFDQQVTPATRQAFGAQGLTVYQAVTLASIVQREAVVISEHPRMVGVFLNRLEQDDLLQADPTVQYSVGYQPRNDTWWKVPISADDLAVDSPYNTYLYPGLPPGPISSPGLSALDAVAAPERTDYYYFVADCTADQPGTHVFSKTFEEHLGHAERCRKVD